MPHAITSGLPAGRWIGTDEAGLGPNLGPLVVSASAWDLPTKPATVDLYSALSAAVDRDSSVNGTRLWIADSKRVYCPGKGLAVLETSATIAAVPIRKACRLEAD